MKPPYAVLGHRCLSLWDSGAGSSIADVFSVLVMSHINVLKGYLSFFSVIKIFS